MILSSEFVSEYNRLSGDVTSSSARTFLDNLGRWFSVLDEERGVLDVVAWLESRVDFDAWFAEQTKDWGLGSARIRWSKKQQQRLGSQLALFRAMSEEKLSLEDFETYFFSTNNIDLAVAEIAQQFFRPFSEDLVRYLSRVSDLPEDFLAPAAVPASDRVVSLDHNSADFKTALKSMDELKVAVEGANDFPDPETKAAQLAEINAGFELLKSVRVRIQALASVLGPSLKWLTEKFAGGIIGRLAAHVIDNFGTLLGSDWLDWL